MENSNLYISYQNVYGHRHPMSIHDANISKNDADIRNSSLESPLKASLSVIQRKQLYYFILFCTPKGTGLLSQPSLNSLGPQNS